jgi:pimeloyl-ACP methyl ester carboxylesterase
LLVRPAGGASLPTALIHARHAEQPDLAPWHLTARFGTFERSFEPRDMVKGWEVPAYVVHGSGDPIVPAAISKECADQFGGQYVEVSSAAHLVVIDQKEAVLRIVADVACGAV